jgi:hypothetical protein
MVLRAFEDETRAVRAQVNEIHEEVRDLRDKIPGL